MTRLIDKMTGTVCISSDICVRADLTRHSFYTSGLGKKSKPSIRNEPWMSWNLPAVKLADKEIFSSIFFNGEKLDMVDVAFNLDPSATTWADWSLEQELRNKAFHDALLEHDLGSPPYEFPWGKVVSIYSERTEASLIVITY